VRKASAQRPDRPSLPIGVFDSGIGGLTVVRALRTALPREDLLYLGDTARVPYGGRGPDTIVRYALQCSRFLASRGLKVLVVACNTVSAVALDILRVEFDVPVIGVIEPSARAAVRASRTGRIGVIGTEGTVRSGAYERALATASTRCEVLAKAAPLLVPLVEEGWLEGDVPRLAVERYLTPLCEMGIDTLILGCTHYPVLRPVIDEVLATLSSRPVVPVSSADAAANDVLDVLRTRELLRAEGRGTTRFFVTDQPQQFARVGTRVFGDDVESAELVDL
jgi:glutamate racemase